MKLTIECKTQEELNAMSISELKEWQLNFKQLIRGQMAVLERSLTSGDRVLYYKERDAKTAATVVDLGNYRAKKLTKNLKMCGLKTEVL